MATQTIQSLLQKREDILKSLNDVNAQIIHATLDIGGGATLASAIPAAGGKRAGGKGGTRRKWFDRGEMIKLSRKLLTHPMTQADLVRGLASAKGYDKGLPAGEKSRFKSAAYQAIAAALNGKQLLRNKQGQVSARR